MIVVTRFAELGAFRNDWLDSHFHFSFADYYDPARMGMGALRVWNDDTIQRPIPVFPPMATRTWRSSPMCAAAPAPRRTDTNGPNL